MATNPDEKALRLRQKAAMTLDPRTADMLRTLARKYEGEPGPRVRR
jgi:hypothetical protein